MEHRKPELRKVEHGDAPEDDPARFLRELRRLRDGADLGLVELAARAHYPRDTIQAAETGPALPDLPVLSAYIRACGGIVAEWEERWRSLTSSPALPLLPVRPAGSSEAATAGARVGSTTPAVDGHDPELIMAALGRVADGIAAEPSSSSLSSPVSGAAVQRFGAAGTSRAAVGRSAGATAMTAPAGAGDFADVASPVGPAGSAAVGGSANPASPAGGVGSPGTGGGFAAFARRADDSAPAEAPRDNGVLAGSRTNPPPMTPLPATGRRPDTRLSLPSKSTVAAIAAVVLCLVATMLALFA